MAKKRAQPVKAAKKSDVPEAPPTPQFYATAKYKQWVRDHLVHPETGKSLMTLEDFAAKIKKADAGSKTTTSNLSQFLGHYSKAKWKPAQPSNTMLMPAINKALGIPPPSICDPLDPVSQLRDRVREAWGALTEEQEKKLLESILGFLEARK